MTDEKCDCWRLTRPLDDDEPLPDHVCPDAAVASVAMWAQEQAHSLAGSIRDTDKGLPGVEIETHTFSDDDRRALGEISEGLDQLIGRMATRWPLAVDELAVGIVIRQWAHEPPNKTLANQLAADKRCEPIIEELRGILGIWLKQNQGMEEEAMHEWLGRDCWSANDAGIQGKDPLAARRLATHLRAVGLPSTPRVMKHLRAVAADLNNDEYLPARGVLVTTRYHVAVEPNGGVWLRQNHSTTIDMPLTAIPMTVFKQVQKVMKGHLAFISHPERVFSYVDSRARRKYQPGSFAQKYGKAADRPVDPEELKFDYVAEAVNSADENVLDKRRGLAAINAHINRAFPRVRKRRVDAGLDPTPPPGARKEARRQLRDLQR